MKMEPSRKAVPAGLRPLRPPGDRSLLQDRAYDEIKNRIQGGDFPAGSFLSERQLAGELGMSKTPIRAALVRLDIEGFVAVSPQQGIVVREPSLQEIVDLFDIRVALESFVVRRVAGTLTAAQKAALKENLREQSDAAKRGDELALTRLDTDFHCLLCSFLGNLEIERVMWQLRDKLHRVILRVMRQAAGRPKSAFQEHAAIAEAVIRGRGEEAADRIARHLEFGKQFLVSR
jgi:DNA-binding GntR family transcriptional regulator